jgi:hypothetical protein
MPRASWAQGTSGIAGVVKDTTGGVLPGVTVEATSPVLIEKVRTVTTDTAGQYKIIDLLPGTYSVTFTMPGFATLKQEKIDLTSNFTATVNADMRVGSLEESVTVSGASPLVDVQNTVQEKVISREVIFALPINRETGGYAAITPGATIAPTVQDVGGNQDPIAQYITIHDTHTVDMRVLVDGMRINAEGTGRGFYFNPQAAQEVGMELGGQGAEYELGGAQLNLIPKEGGNRFVGSFIGAYTSASLENNNASAALLARNQSAVNSVDWIYDANGAVGGPIVPNKLWFYTAHRAWGFANFIAGDYADATEGGPLYTPNLSKRAVNNETNITDGVRFTYQLSARNKFSLSYDHQDTCLCHTGLTALLAPEASQTRYYKDPNYLVQAKWSFPATNKLLLEAADTSLIFDWPNYRVSEANATAIPTVEASTNFTYNAPIYSNTGHREADQSNQRFTMSYVTGSHAFKAGATMQEGWHYWQYGEPTVLSGDVSYTFLNQQPLNLTEWAAPITTKERLKANVGLFVQDQWTLKRLTLNVGLRYDYMNQAVPAQTLPAGPFVPARNFAAVPCVPCWHDLDPRFGAVYDLFGDGKTALKAYVGRYIQADIFTLSHAVNPVVTSVNSITRTWTDTNGNYSPDCDLTNPGANGECGAISNNFFGESNPKANTYTPQLLTGFGHRPYDWQSSVSIQRQLAAGVSVNAGFFRTWYGNFYETDNVDLTPASFDSYCITTPVSSGLPGGGGYPVCGLYDVKPSLFGVVKSVVSLVPSGQQSEVYNGFDLTMNARLQNGLYISGGVSAGRTETNNCAVVLGNPQITFTNALSLLSAPYQQAYCDVVTPWSAQTQLKLSGTYALPWWKSVVVSSTFQSLPGIPDYATDVITSAQIAPSLGRNLAAGAGGSITTDLIPPQSRFENRYNQLDARLSKTFQVGKTRVQGMLDVYNVLNGAGILSINARVGPQWLTPTQILSARLFKFGAQVNF